MKGTTIVAALLSVSLLGCGGRSSEEQAAASPEPEEAAAAVDTANAVTADASGTRVKLFVTEDGFVPARVEIPADRPVTLVVTRTTDRTCATELVLKEHGINQALPLNQPIEIRFTPARAGELTYACGMDMYKGTLVVQ